MPARVYQPSGKSEPGAIPSLVVVCAVVGAVAGVVEALIAHYVISLFLIFPLVLGAVVGGFAAKRIAKGKIRAPMAAALAGLVGGFVGQLSVHAVEYYEFRSTVSSKIAGIAAKSGQSPDQIIDAVLVHETGHAGLRGYLALQAKQGISIKDEGESDDKGIKFTGVGAYLLWIVEFLLVMGVAALMAANRARKPFCESCKRWYDQNVPVVSGSGDKKDWSVVVQNLERGDFAAAVAARGQVSPKTASTIVLERCSQCDSHDPLLDLKVTKALNTKKPQTSTVYRTLLHPDDARALLAAVEATRAKAAS